MNRNVDDHFAHTPTPHFPRSKFDMGVHKRLQTQKHGRLTPFFCRIVYPGDTWQMDLNTFVRMDTSLRVPLDDIYLDTYFFFVPFRIIDDNFAKVLGDKEPYDDDEYNIPQFTVLEDNGIYSADCLLGYLNYHQANPTINTDNKFYSLNDDSFCAYPLAAYYKIYNDWFRDENLDPSIPYTDLYGADGETLDAIFKERATVGTGVAAQYFPCLAVNRYHDLYSSCVTAPQKGVAQTIPMGTSAPVLTSSTVIGNDNLNAFGLGFSSLSGTTISDISSSKIMAYSATGKGTSYDVPAGTSLNSNNIIPNNLYADLSKVAGTINELRLAFAIQSLYERRGRFGTRYIETIRGQWGIEVPDQFFLRPEYLGGSRVTLNNVPVLSTENSSQLGQMAGNSATLSGKTTWSKTFIDYGLIIGVSCTRIKHSYGQGRDIEIWDLKTYLDLYNPVFANTGMYGLPVHSIFNEGDQESSFDDVFAYQEPWPYLRTCLDSYAGLFAVESPNTELKNKWHYGDYYSSAPSFSADWLKESVENVSRTLTGQLINGASSTEGFLGHQFMFGYFYHPVVTRILPSHSVPVELIGRL